MRQMNSNKPLDNLLVKMRQARLLQAQPTCKVGISADMAVQRLCGISAVAKVGKKRDDMRSQDTLLQLAEHLWMRDDSLIHDDLL